jgi:MFS family permease
MSLYACKTMHAGGSPRGAVQLVLLVTLAVFINYIDRGNLATAAPLIQDDLHLRATELGILMSAFYYGYVPCMPLMGWLAERFGTHKIFAGAVAVWSIATLLTGFAGSFVTLLALRILLGIGESAAFPCASKVIANTVEVSRLGVANGFMSFGYLLGPAVGTLIGGYLMTVIGWRAVFIIFGSVSLLWLIPWSLKGSALKATTAQLAGLHQPTFSTILKQRALWGASIGHFASNYGYYFIVSWLPFYLVKARGFSIHSMAEIASYAYLLNALSAFGMGWLTDRWIRHGRNPTVIYKSIMGITHLVGIGCMAGMVLLPEKPSIAALFIFELVSGCSYTGLFAIPQILAGPQATGRWVGVQNAAGNVAGIIAPLITGILVDQTGHFELAFGLAAAINLLGFMGWVFIMPAVRPIHWPTRATHLTR